MGSINTSPINGSWGKSSAKPCILILKVNCKSRGEFERIKSLFVELLKEYKFGQQDYEFEKDKNSIWVKRFKGGRKVKK